ncbi:MAG: efflux RND transporter permease subunit [Bdellovibrionales bacterium]|nr:efflux RND transporter permease subunit [Bdellovibrionales bacterium]
MLRFFTWVLGNKLLLMALATLVFAWSLFGLTTLNISAVPDITNKQVMINTKTGSFSTEQIEKIVTYPIEIEMSGLPGVHEVRSLSKYGLSQVIVVFEDEVDLYFARQVVNERLQAAKGQLPAGLTPELGPVSTGLGEILMWVLQLKADSPEMQKSRKEQLQYLRRIQDFYIRPRIKRIPGVAEVDTNGGFNTEVHINYFPAALDKYGINVSDLIDSVREVGTSFGGSYIKNEDQQITVRSLVPIKDLSSIEGIVLKRMPSGKNIFVKDVCSVKFESSPRVGGATFDGEETVLGTLLMRIGSNSRNVARAAKKELEVMSLPSDVELKVVYNREYLVNKTIGTVTKNLIEGALLVIFILMLVLGNFKASIIVSMAIPMSMLVALKGMKMFGISANLMSLGAIDFGLLVDASVVMVENFLRRMGHAPSSLDAKARLKLLAESCAEVSKPVIFGLAIIMLVYVPILSLEGVEGKMFEPMALTVLMALGVSLIVALLVIPILLFLVFGKGVMEKEPLLFRWIKASYTPVLNKVLVYRKSTLLAGLILFISALLVFLRLGADFVPQLDEGDLVIGLVRDSKQHIDKSIDEQTKAENIIKQFAEVDYVFSRIGTPESATDPMGPNFADTFVMLKKKSSDWPLVNGKKRSKTELFEAIAIALEKGMDAQDISSTQPIEMRFNEILEGSRADITLRFLGPDLDDLLNYANQAEILLKDINGVQSVEFDALTGLTKSKVLDIEVSSEQALIYDLKPLDVNEYVKSSLAGEEVGTFFLNGIKTPFVFHLDEEVRDNIDRLKKLPVPLKEGGTVELEKLAQFHFSDRVTTIARRWAERYSAISIYVKDRDISSIVGEAKEKLDQNIKLKAGYAMEWGGQFKNLERARSKLLVIVPLTLLIIFFMIFFMTNSLAQALVIFTAVPMGLAGGVFMLALRGMNFSVSAAVGFIALSGIVILNSMVLVNYINQHLSSDQDVIEVIREGALSRLRPVVMTALVAGLGFLPMAFNTGMGAEVQRPLATVVIGGLITSTLLTMLVVPTLLVITLKSKH